MDIPDKYIAYIRDIRRYSPRTCSIYKEAIDGFFRYAFADMEDGQEAEATALAGALTPNMIRGYEAFLIRKGLKARTVNLHISALSGFCRFLIKEGILTSNPARLVAKPKSEKRLPLFYRDRDMKEYFASTEFFAGELPSGNPEEITGMYLSSKGSTGYRPASDSILAEMEQLAGNPEKFSCWLYRRKLGRAIVSTLFSTGARRAELISMKRGDMDFSRKIMTVRGKGDRTREIPLIPSLCKELLLYLQAVDSMVGSGWAKSSPLFVTLKGNALYPEFVDRIVKEELGRISGITGRKSPHVLRHTVATELLDEGADLNSIKEMLGHTSLAATQVYTHNSIEKLKKVYQTAHPRAKNGGKNGD